MKLAQAIGLNRPATNERVRKQGGVRTGTPLCHLVKRPARCRLSAGLFALLDRPASPTMRFAPRPTTRGENHGVLPAVIILAVHRSRPVGRLLGPYNANLTALAR